VQGGLTIGIGLEQFTHDRGGSFIDFDQRGITRSFWMDAIAVWRVRPWQQPTGPQLGLTSTSHPVCNQRPFVLGDGTPDLKDELLMRVVARRAIDEYHADPMPLEFFEDDHLVYVVACQTVWSRDQHDIEAARAAWSRKASRPGRWSLAPV
jgi:hypothetical protein